MPPMPFRSHLTQWLDAGIILCLGLFPVLHLHSLQVALLLILVGVISKGPSLLTVPSTLGWHHIMILQFAVFFLVNALWFEALPEIPDSQKAVAIESWITTILGLILFWLYLNDGRSFALEWRFFLPIGLIASFAIMTYFFLFLWDGSGDRVRAFASESLTPPMWYLALTLISFAGFHHFSRLERLLRFGLMGLSAVMIMYAGARLSLIAWCLSAIFLSLYLIQLQPAARRNTLRLYTLFGAGVFVISIYLLDRATTGILDERIRETLDGLSTESTTFFRLEIWRAALVVISETLPWGIGQINERPMVSAALDPNLLAAREIMPNLSIRAHQTYLSFLIAGGYLALASGILFQLSGLRLLQAHRGSGMMPAVFGLFCIPALNCLTDSLFQSYVAVQFYVLLTLVLSNEVQRSPTQ